MTYYCILPCSGGEPDAQFRSGIGRCWDGTILERPTVRTLGSMAKRLHARHLHDYLRWLKPLMLSVTVFLNSSAQCPTSNRGCRQVLFQAATIFVAFLDLAGLQHREIITVQIVSSFVFSSSCSQTLWPVVAAHALSDQKTSTDLCRGIVPSIVTALEVSFSQRDKLGNLLPQQEIRCSLHNLYTPLPVVGPDSMYSRQVDLYLHLSRIAPPGVANCRQQRSDTHVAVV